MGSAKILVIVGVILAFLLLLAVYTVWKYIREKQKKNKKSNIYRLLRGSEKESNQEPKFQLPISYIPIMAQTPFSIPSSEGGSQSNDNLILSRSRSRSRSKVNTSITGYDVEFTSDDSERSNEIMTASSLRGLIDVRLVEKREPTMLEQKQQSTVNDAVEHLSRQGRKVSHSDLRGGRRTSSRGSAAEHESILQKLSLDDEEETFSTTTVATKRKIAGRRMQRNDRQSSSVVMVPKKVFKKSGRISFTTHYLKDLQSLEIHILQAYDLVSKRDIADVNPFVRLYLCRGKKQKQNTKYYKCTKEPFINEKLLFTDLREAELIKHKLKVIVYNHGKLKRNEVLGEVDFPLGSLNLEVKETFDVDLYKEKIKPVSSSIQIALCHKAAFSKLEVIIKQAKDLPKCGVSGTPNAYVSALLFKETSMDRKETVTKRNTKDPCFSETLEFDVNTDCTTPIRTYTLVVTLNNRNIMGKDDVLGHVIFSVTSPQKSAVAHWNKVINGPHKHHEDWHKLIEPDEF